MVYRYRLHHINYVVLHSLYRNRRQQYIAVHVGVICSAEQSDVQRYCSWW
jgi:hypothetical protein